jgi:rRNA biogenesis protein RRP5
VLLIPCLPDHAVCVHLLSAGEIDAARQVAERALRTIAMTSERDKFNVWVALMNLENAYGGAEAEDAVMAVFKRCVHAVCCV